MSLPPSRRRSLEGRALIRAPLFLLILTVLVGCSDDGTGPRNLEPLVGTWRARVLLMTNTANPQSQVDLVQEGGQFTLSILSDGTYSATLSGYGSASTEAGTISASGNQVTLTPTLPPGDPQTSVFSFQGSTLILDGDSAFDFNLDGIPEAANLHMELDPLDP